MGKRRSAENGTAGRASLVCLSERCRRILTIPRECSLFVLDQRSRSCPGASAGGRMLATILHADLDAFYASVEQLLDPSLRGKPLAVGGGVVLAASYEAKAYGVTAGMAGWRARRLCPGLLFAGGHFRDYQRLADEVMAVFHDFTPAVERISIDEAFLDVA